MAWFFTMLGKLIVGCALLWLSTVAFMVLLSFAGWTMPDEFSVEFVIGMFYGIGWAIIYRWAD